MALLYGVSLLHGTLDILVVCSHDILHDCRRVTVLFEATLKMAGKAKKGLTSFLFPDFP